MHGCIGPEIKNRYFVVATCFDGVDILPRIAWSGYVHKPAVNFNFESSDMNANIYFIIIVGKHEKADIKRGFIEHLRVGVSVVPYLHSVVYCTAEHMLFE